MSRAAALFLDLNPRNRLNSLVDTGNIQASLYVCINVHANAATLMTIFSKFIIRLY